MPSSKKRTQQLVTTNVTANIGEALAARTKDPLWFLARQWQTGEFEAENGGRPASILYSSSVDPFSSVSLGEGASKSINTDQPLDSVVEAEHASIGTADAWRPRTLDYSFGLDSRTHKFKAAGYKGFNLDWYHFNYVGKATGAAPKKSTVEMTPNQLYFRGAPHPRWWRFEEDDAWFDSPVDAEPNVLSLLLPEFFYLDVRNWYVIPASMPSGSVRELSDLKVADSFGVVTDIKPAKADDWQLYTIDSTTNKKLGSEFLFSPNIALDVVRIDTLEDVRFIRDESANMVWAWEQYYIDPVTGDSVSNGDSVRIQNAAASTGSNSSIGSYKLQSTTPANWIPYVPRQIDPGNPTDGGTYFRRARTVESATLQDPQYKSLFVEETRLLNEEEIPKTGLRLRRMSRYARGSNGKVYTWVGRGREAGKTNQRSNLRFDYIEK